MRSGATRSSPPEARSKPRPTVYSSGRCRIFLYNDRAWIAHVQRSVDEAIAEDGGSERSSVGLIGHSKDKSYYLRMFPNWDAVDVPTQHGTLNSTDLREDYLRRAPRIPDAPLCPAETSEFLARFMLTDAFKWLVGETEFYRDYKAAWGKTPYPSSSIASTPSSSSPAIFFWSSAPVGPARGCWLCRAAMSSPMKAFTTPSCAN